MMRINYFGALNLTMGLLPGMAARQRGHVINISSIGVLTDAPRFSAYVASKAALEAWTRCAASEFLDCGIHFTTINMPLIRTPMIAPTKFYSQVPTLTPEQAAELVVQAVIQRPARLATKLGTYAHALNAVMPRLWQVMMNTGFRMFPDSAAARGHAEMPTKPSADQIAFAELLRGIHF